MKHIYIQTFHYRRTNNTSIPNHTALLPRVSEKGNSMEMGMRTLPLYVQIYTYKHFITSFVQKGTPSSPLQVQTLSETEKEEKQGAKS